ncbi:thiamine phosphate synthase [Undibacterium terreum]|uniref:Thiamine-phosphate synthase n=1 Tax=Undibacterium terreum TaxID=1224302 RepID=A0A916XLF5_9BURK|nr:thiamine phosphate synthase [Undibacterium terreum]GGC80002.1 thiamine-phosphate synthase [Undibacterium terreum]
MTTLSNLLKGLYLVTPDWDDTQKLLDATEQALLGGAAVVQYRHKFAGEALRHEQAHALLQLCRHYQRTFIINDHVNLCLELDADGVHVGGTDASVAEVRMRLGKEKIVGASCYGDMQLARLARDTEASYVAFGGFYPSRVKKYAVTTPHSIIGQAKSEIPLPNVVIGGMTVDNAAPLVAAGADMVAAISSVYMAQDTQAAAAAFAALFAART